MKYVPSNGPWFVKIDDEPETPYPVVAWEIARGKYEGEEVTFGYPLIVWRSGLQSVGDLAVNYSIEYRP